MSRLIEKKKQINQMLKELDEIMPTTYTQYCDIKTKAACERYFEKITEAQVDIAILLIKDLRLKLPEDEKSSYDVLQKENIITKELSIKLKQAKGMRNIIAHMYGTIDDEMVYKSITEELVKDTLDFIKAIEKF